MPEMDKSERFQVADVPPAPADGFFFMATTLFVSGVVPFVLGNLLLDFLRDVTAVVSKVRRQKFSIKADISGGSFGDNPEVAYHPCGLKIRVYRHEADCAVEFRRCTGDAVAFNDLFRRASRYLSLHSDAEATMRS